MAAKAADPVVEVAASDFKLAQPSAADIAALEQEKLERERKEAWDAAAQQSATEERVAQARTTYRISYKIVIIL